MIVAGAGSGAVRTPCRAGAVMVPISAKLVPSREIQTFAPPQLGSATPPLPPETAIQTCASPPVSPSGGSKTTGGLAGAAATLRLMLRPADPATG